MPDCWDRRVLGPTFHGSLRWRPTTGLNGDSHRSQPADVVSQTPWDSRFRCPDPGGLSDSPKSQYPITA
ncbi:hypothetical protein CGCF413_v004862 [Colletotrichum fructicola]|nr:hypothetical protein CGCF413_v004862 [Colletotrichum fructicola]